MQLQLILISSVFHLLLNILIQISLKIQKKQLVNGYLILHRVFFILDHQIILMEFLDYIMQVDNIFRLNVKGQMDILTILIIIYDFPMDQILSQQELYGKKKHQLISLELEMNILLFMQISMARHFLANFCILKDLVKMQKIRLYKLQL